MFLYMYKSVMLCSQKETEHNIVKPVFINNLPVIIYQYKQIRTMQSFFTYSTSCIILVQRAKFYNRLPPSGIDKTTLLAAVPVTSLSREVTDSTVK